MKKVLFLLGVAVFLITACIKSETVVKDSPKEIGFKAMTQIPTKADPEHKTTYLDHSYDIYVGASTTDNPTFLSGQTFSYNTDCWKASSSVIWPRNQLVDFLALAGETGFQSTLSPAFYSSPSAKSVTISDWDTYTYQLDVMYAVANGRSQSVGPVSLSFQHALALLSFTVQADVADKVKIERITINNLEYQGTLEVDNTNSEVVATWTAMSGTDMNVKGVKTSDFVGTSSTQWADNLLIPEQISKSMTIVYTLGGSSITYKLNIPRTLWKMGHKYVYDLNFNTSGSEITFTATVEGWDTTNINPPVIN